MSQYLMGDVIVLADDPRLQDELALAYANKVRPQCLCRKPAPEMYVAKLAQRFVLKRMPNTGASHAPDCNSYEPPADLSGLGQVIGSAIHEDHEKGLTTLKFDFSLSKTAGRAAPAMGDSDASSVATDGNRLTLRATLHYLWEQAGFSRWAPAMAGKRSWYVIRKYLLQAAGDKMAKGMSLADLLFIPESFNVERKYEIEQRRIAHTAKAGAPHGATRSRQLMLVIGEVKDIAVARYGHKIVFKHLPDWHFMVNDDLHRRLVRRFESELCLWDALVDTHLVMIGTFSVNQSGVACLEEIALMTATGDWIPFESSFDKMLIDAMVTANRRFSKGLRYNLPATRPVASLLAADTNPQPTAMYVLAPAASADVEAALDALIESSALPSWIWRTGEVMPSLPHDQPAQTEHARQAVT